MILVGLDDTDTLETPGTNQLARRIARTLPPAFRATLIVRHQLLLDFRIPYTSRNGSASIAIQDHPGADRTELLAMLRRAIRDRYVPGSDPGLAVARRVPPEVVAFGRRCQREPVRQAEARALARSAGVHLEGLGGSEDGVVGALAAVGLLAWGDDGRVIHRPGWDWPDHFSGWQQVAAVRARGVDAVLLAGSGRSVETGMVDVGRHLRPSYRAGRVVLFVEPGETPESWRAVRLA